MRYTFEDLGNSDESEPSKTSKAYRETFWSHLDEQFPGVQNHAIVDPDYEEPEGDTMLGRKVDDPGLVRTMSGLAEWRYTSKDKGSSSFERNTGYKRPYFQLSGTAANNNPDYTQFPDREYADGLSLNVYPAKSFVFEEPSGEPFEGSDAFGDRDGMETSGAVKGLKLFACGKSRTVECDVKTTGNGDRVITSQDPKDNIYSQTHTVALLRESDGVGIVVSDEWPINNGVGGSDDQSSSDESDDDESDDDESDDTAPALSLDDLTELAQALPEKPVK